MAASEGVVKKLEAQCTVLKRELERNEKNRCVQARSRWIELYASPRFPLHYLGCG